MSDEEREVTLVLNARNLAGKALDGFSSAVKGIGDTAEAAARKVGRGFENATNAVSNAFGNLTENLLQGGDLGASMLTFGTYLGGQMAEGLIGQALERLGASTLVGALGGVLSGAGAAIGGLLDTAIGVGMAALPFVLIAAIGAAVIYLVNNPEVAGKVGAFVSDLLGKIGDLLGALPGVLLGAFGAAWSAVTSAVPAVITTIVGFFLSIPGALIGLGVSIVETIIGGLVSLPGRVADVVRQAFAGLRIDVGPFHVSGSGITIDLPDFSGGRGVNNIQGVVPHLAEGAVVSRPTLAVIGEGGEREWVVPESKLGAFGAGDTSSRGVRIIGVSEDELLDMVERGLYFRLAAAGT